MQWIARRNTDGERNRDGWACGTDGEYNRVQQCRPWETAKEHTQSRGEEQLHVATVSVLAEVALGEAASHET